MAELTGTLVSHVASFEGNLGKEATWGLINGDISDQEDLQSALNLKAESSDLTDHVSDTNNPHEVTKAQLGLGNVDNTSDINKPISSATQVALNGKVSDVKVNGQSVVTDMVANVTIPTLTSDLTNDSGFIDKDVNNLTNYTLSSNLSEVATSGDYEDLNNKPSIPTKTSDLTNDSGFVDKDVNDLTNYTKTSDLATVATSGSYNDLSNKPSIPTVNNATLTIQKNGSTVETFTANASSNVTANITVPTKTSDLTNDSGFISSASWGGIEGTLSNQTDLKNALDTKATTDQINNLQSQIDLKANSSEVDSLEIAVSDLSTNKVDKVSGKGLSTNDFTNADKTKLDGIESGAEVNVIEDIEVDNVSLIPTNKSVNIDLSGKENVSNKTTTLSSASTDTQYPSAKCVYDEISPLETAISNLNQNVVKLDGNQAISGEKRFVHLGATSNLYNYVSNGQGFDVYILELPQEVGTLATQDYVDNIVGDIETLLEAI